MNVWKGDEAPVLRRFLYDDDRDTSGTHESDGTTGKNSRPPVLVNDDINGATESEHVVRPVIAEEIDSSVPMIEVRNQLPPQSSDVGYCHPNPKLFGIVSGNDMGRELRKECDKDDLVGATC
ncbi:hypothetical protein FCV25MIE_04357 [Fagus crenata]